MGSFLCTCLYACNGLLGVCIYGSLIIRRTYFIFIGLLGLIIRTLKHCS